jgi:hypothetical protein
MSLLVVTDKQGRSAMCVDDHEPVPCSVLDIIVVAANRVWERGKSEQWFDHSRIANRPE